MVEKTGASPLRTLMRPKASSLSAIPHARQLRREPELRSPYGLAARAHEEGQLDVLGAPKSLEGHARALLPGRLVVGEGRVEPSAYLVDARGLELSGAKASFNSTSMAPRRRAPSSAATRRASLDDRGEHGHLEELQELGGRGNEGQGGPVPGLLPFGEDADDPSPLPYHLDRPVDRLDVRYGLRLGYRADERRRARMRRVRMLPSLVIQ